MLLKRVLLVSCFLFLGFLVGNAFCSEPGKRPDKSPWFGSISDKVIDKYEDLYDLKTEKDQEIKKIVEKRNKEIAELNKNKIEAPNWAIIRKSKSDYDEVIAETNNEFSKRIAEITEEYNSKIRVLKNEIVDTMASPSTDDLKEKKEAAAKIQYISEMYETYSAIVNIREVVRSLNSELRLNLSDYKLASKTYAVQLELLSLVNNINDIFINRLDTFYMPKLKGQIEKNKSAMKNNIEDMKRDKNIPKDYVKKQNDTLKIINKNIKKAISDIEKIKEKQLNNRKIIVTQYSKTRIIKRVSDSAKESSTYVAQINDAFDTIKIDIPELVEFSYREADLEVALQ